MVLNNPEDFIFQVNQDEMTHLKSHFATSSWGGRRTLPFAFTEHGAIMAATVLKSPRAVDVAVYVVRAFIRLRELVTSNKELALRLEQLENKTELIEVKHENFERNTRLQLNRVVEAIHELSAQPDPPKKRRIGFEPFEDEPPK